MNPHRQAEYLAKLPEAMRDMLNVEQMARNEIADILLADKDNQGIMTVLLRLPFQATRSGPVEYRFREAENCEYQTADGRFTLAAPNPDPKQSKSADTPARSAHDRFIASMVMNFDMWHDGLGYDLAALKECTPAESKSVESVLIQHSPRDWRDIEALAQIDSPRSRATVEEALTSRDPMVRQTAMDYAGEKVNPADRERLMIQSIQRDDLFGGLSQTIDEIPNFHPPAVMEALFKAALNRDGDAAVHFAALLFYLHGKSSEPFDWSHRPFFLRFNTSDRAERKAVFRELCETVGVDPAKYVR